MSKLSLIHHVEVVLLVGHMGISKFTCSPGSPKLSEVVKIKTIQSLRSDQVMGVPRLIHQIFLKKYRAICPYP